MLNSFAIDFLRWVGVYITDFSIIFTLIGVCVTYQLTFTQLLSAVPGVPFSDTELTILSALIIFPLSCAKNLSFMSSVSLLGLVFLSVGVFSIIYFGIINLPRNSEEYVAIEFPLWPSSISGFFAYIGVASFCYALCFLVFPIQESLKEKSEVGIAILYALCFCWSVYAVLSGAGVLYVYSNSTVQSNILLNLPVDSGFAVTVRLCMAMVMTLFIFCLTIEIIISYCKNIYICFIRFVF
jgi:amino acid permease